VQVWVPNDAQRVENLLVAGCYSHVGSNSKLISRISEVYLKGSGDGA
jgi:hypothetical protein